MNQYEIPEIINDDFIKDFFFKNDNIQRGRINKQFLTRFPNLLYYINTRFNDSMCISETIWRIYYNIEHAPKCPICGKLCKWRGRNNYTQHCSYECMHSDKELSRRRGNILKNKSPEEKEIINKKKKQSYLLHYGNENLALTDHFKEKYTNTMLNRYGVKYFSQSNEIKEKIKQTNIKNLGVEWPGQNHECILKGQETCMKRYGVNHNLKIPSVILHRQQIWEERYGGNTWSNKDIRNKCYNTSIEKYGNLNNYEQIKKTCMERYGVEYIFQCEEFKQHAKQVMLEKYGNTCFPQSHIYKNYLLEKYNVEYFSQTKEWADKSYLTKKQNNSFHTSKIEQQFKEYLEQNFPNDFEYQYKSELYPFNCYFYIKSLDLYIEIQGTWMHGSHPFNENNQEDIDRLNYWKEKGTPGYMQAMCIWTIKDVNKRNIAKQNNLKYLEIFSNNIINAINILINYINQINGD